VEGNPTFARKKLTVQVLDRIADQIERFLLVQLFTSLVVGLATWAALWAVGLRQPAVWGLAAGVFNSIPYFGPIIVTGALTVVAFLQFGTFTMALSVAAIALAITTLEGWLLTPTLLSRTANMNQVAVFIGLIFWSWIWGVWGMLLAVPMLMVVKAVCDHIEDLQPVGQFLGE
jgi:predicted PurR-regulated permease PerM